MTSPRRRPGPARLAIALVWIAAIPATQSRAQTSLDLEGTVTRADLHTYLERSFDVPDGTVEIEVSFDYDTRDQRTTLDLGLESPHGFRGWSGGSRSTFRLSEDHATPGYLAGPIEPGVWRLVIGVPNIRRDVRAGYRATITLRTGASDRSRPTPPRERTGALEAPATAVSHGAPRWFRGDLHMHTGHSDGSCLVNGERRPCPLERTLAAARARGLDFIAVTEHNTVSHLPSLPTDELGLTVLPGQEVTTFRGHLNVIGTTRRIPFRRADGSPRDPNQIAEEARDLGAFVVINHPGLPSGEACMGCGWKPAETTLDQVHAVEVINGGVMKNRNGAAEGLFSGISFWERALDAGRGWVAIGASDNHDPDLPTTEPGALGHPTTVVWARSARDIDLLAGLRSGRIFVDVEGHPSRWLDVTLQSQAGRHRTPMGGLWTGPRKDLELVVDCGDCSGLVAELRFGSRSGDSPGTVVLGTLDGDPARIRFPIEQRPTELEWLRVDLRRADGSLAVLGNPIRLQPAPAQGNADPPGPAKR